MGKLEGKIALVSGGATGIGASIVKGLAAKCCRVGYHYFRSSPDMMERSLNAQRVESIGIQGDLTRDTTMGGDDRARTQTLRRSPALLSAMQATSLHDTHWKKWSYRSFGRCWP
jgi:NAD(P)-dependent dehydrogenase (short-subunit alcohol dehydrogenase family)